MTQPKISIITAVYNKEKYICRCIESILNQTFKDFELLLINDGSTDNSGNLCNEYASKDSRIKVYHKTNGGVAAARELGISLAKGIYSIHIDPDDWIEYNMLEEMYNQIISDKSSVLITDYYVSTNNQKIYIKTEPNCLESHKLLIDLVEGNFFGSLCHKLIKHSLYNQYNIHFYNGINYCEDFLIWAQLLQNPIKISYLNKAFYYYFIDNTDSISRNYNIRKYNERKKFYYKLESILPEDLKCKIYNVALNIKIEAFVNNLMDRREFYSFAPTKIKDIVFNKKLNIKIKFTLLFAIFFSFETGYSLYKKLQK